MDGGKTWVFYLREGLKWSDGMPYTADDMLFWHEYFFLNPDYPSIGADYITLAWRGSGVIESMDKVDDYTVRFEFHEPTESLLNSAFGSHDPGIQQALPGAISSPTTRMPTSSRA